MLAHNYSRSPRFQGARDDDYVVYNEFVNNVNYNWGKVNACYGGENNSPSNRYQGHQVNFVNNYWKPGPATIKGNSSGRHNFMRPTAGTRISEWYLSGNVMEGMPELSEDNVKGVEVDGDASKVKFVDEFIVPSKFYPDYKFDVTAYTMKDKLESAEDAYRTVLAKVGTINRDAIEKRIIREATEGTATYGGSWQNNGKYGIIDDQTDAEMVKQENGFSIFPDAPEPIYRDENFDSDGDGMPDEWETANGFDPADGSDGNHINAEGYTALEKYLASLMGEEINGEFGTSISIRNEHAVKFDISVEGSVIKVVSEADVCGMHVFDDMGRCRLTSALTRGENTIYASALGKGVFIVWVTDKDGYRNAKKVMLNK